LIPFNLIFLFKSKQINYFILFLDFKREFSQKKLKPLRMANDYFKLMNEARKNGAESFTYNGKTYVATKTKTGMTVYKAK
jgi:hypothetical protein